MPSTIMTEEERKEIVDWITLNKSNFLFVDGNHFTHIILENLTDIAAYTQEGTKTEQLEYWNNLQKEHYKNNTLSPYDLTMPSCIWKIKQRIIEKENLFGYKQEPIFQDYIAILHPPAYINKHKDSNKDNLIHCRFNVFIELPKKGGETYYNDIFVDVKEGSYVLCKSGLEEHYTTPLEEGNRISISFGFLIPKERVDMMT